MLICDSPLFCTLSKNINKKNYYIASKYEEICAPQIEEFCNITDNTYFKEEVGPALLWQN